MCAPSPDITVKAASFEDSAALAGLVLAALGLTLRQLDRLAGLGRRCLHRHRRAPCGRRGQARHDSKELLIGRAASPALERSSAARSSRGLAWTPCSSCAPCT